MASGHQFKNATQLAQDNLSMIETEKSFGNDRRRGVAYVGRHVAILKCET